MGEPAPRHGTREPVDDGAALARPEEAAPAATSGLALTLLRHDAARARGFARIVTLLCAVGLSVLPVLGGVLWLRALFGVSVATLGVVAARTWWLARNPVDYDSRAARLFAAFAALASAPVALYVGVFSPAPMLVVLGVAFFAMSDDPFVAFGAPLTSAAGYAIVAGLAATGHLQDIGLFPFGAVGAPVLLATLGLVVGVTLLSIWQGRVTRRAMLDALHHATAAMREMRSREARLEEANRDLDLLMRMANGRAGSYSGLSAGSYQIVDLLARGAMGEVYAATHTQDGTDAAVKVLQPSMIGDSQLVARFLREGKAASQLQQPNVVTIYEVGTLGTNGAPYIAMERLRGHDLGWHLRQRGSLPLDEVVSLAEQVGLGLEAARAAGIVHRDLKPQNLFLAQQHGAAPAWKILDFGVSRFAGSTGTLTLDQIVGTPGYMSPEQAGGREVTHRSDVFSFGAVLYRALTGEPAFSGPDTPQVLYQVVYRNPTRPSLLTPGLPPDVDLVLALALAKDPADRFPSSLELAASLRAAQEGRSDPALRVHAQTILADLPWGTSAYEGGSGAELPTEG